MRVGSIVECVKPFKPHPHPDTILPRLNCRYVVRELVTEFGATFLRLEEIVNPPRYYGADEAFRIDHFRELNLPPSLEKEIQELLEVFEIV
jgi:hypothetical protein